MNVGLLQANLIFFGGVLERYLQIAFGFDIYLSIYKSAIYKTNFEVKTNYNL